MFRTITAKFNGKCKRCNGAIVAGSKIRYGGPGRTYHMKADCGGVTPEVEADKVFKASGGFAGRSLDESLFSEGQVIDDEPHDTRGPMHNANDVALERWAKSYDDLNGAPEDAFDF